VIVLKLSKVKFVKITVTHSQSKHALSEVKNTTLRKLIDGYRPHSVSKNGDICLHCELEATSK